MKERTVLYTLRYLDISCEGLNRKTGSQQQSATGERKEKENRKRNKLRVEITDRVPAKVRTGRKRSKEMHPENPKLKA